MLPNINTASIITTGCNFTVSEKIIGTSKLPSRACKRRYKPINKYKILFLDQTAINQLLQ